LVYLSPKGKIGHDSAGFAQAQNDAAGIGLIPPRLETPIRPSASFGPDVADWSSVFLGIDLMPWQIHALSGQLAHDDDFNLLHRQSLVTVSRQNGKTVALKALIGWFLTVEATRRGKPQTVISVAHKLDLGVALFQDLAPILEAKFGAEAKWSYGRNELTMPDGSKWLVRAATPAAGHGYSPTLVVCDEIWDISTDVIFSGLIPSQRAQKSPLLSCWSTAGTEDSKAMLKLREQGLRAIDTNTPGRLYFAEWSPGPGGENDPSQWHQANPALGHTLEFETLLDESQTPDRASFLRASLNLWISSSQSWISPGLFEKLQVDAIPSGGVLCVDSSIDEQQYCGLRAVLQPDGKVGVTIQFVVDTLAEAWEEIATCYPTIDTLALTPALHDLAPMEYRKKVTVGYKELLTYTAVVRSMMNEGRLVHTGEQMLSEHMNRAVGVRTQQGFVLSSQKSPGPITLARCAVFAAALASRPKWKNKPAMATGG
jgi:phage terminase large subunit-like protein